MDIQKAVISALVDHFATTVPPHVLASGSLVMGEVLPGWPDWEEDGSWNSGKPGISITPQRHTVVWGPPKTVSKTDNADGITLDTVYKLGNVELDVMLDIWAPYKGQLDRVAGAVEQNMHNRLPWNSGLFLGMPDYFDAVLSVFTNPRTSRTPTNITQYQSLFRRTFALKVNAPLLCSGSTPKQAVLSMVHTTQVGGVQVTEPTFEVE